MHLLLSYLTSAGIKILIALVVFFVGRYVIKLVMKALDHGKFMEKLDPTVRVFAVNAVKSVLYVMLGIMVISVLGVPMASVITVLASCGVAVGLALQGALSNLAGGIMILIFRPFKVGDYVDAAGASGVVQEVSLFYTVLLTLDNKRVTVPNGSLMNSNVVDYSSEELRRVDLTFNVAKSEKPAQVQEVLLNAAKNTSKVLTSPEPFARLSGGSNEAMEFTVRAWVKSEDYWDVYFDLTQNAVEALGAAGVQQPAARLQVENK